MILLVLARIASAAPDTLRRMEQGLSLRAAGALSEAAVVFEEVARSAPDRPEPWVELAITRAWAGEHESALQAIEHALSLDPSLRGALAVEARILSWSGRYTAAEAAWRRLIEADPTDADAWAGLGSLALARGLPGKATAAFDEALRLQPDSLEAHEGRAMAYQSQRGELRLGATGWQWQSGEPGVGTHLEARYAPASRVSLRGRVGHDRPIEPELSLSDPAWQGEAEITGRLRSGLTLGAGLEQRVGTARWTGAPLSATVPIAGVRSSVGWRPGWSDGGSDHLVRAAVALGEGTWVQLQGVHWRSARGDGATGGSLTFGMAPGSHSARVDVGLTRTQGGWLGTLCAGWESGWWARQAVGLEVGVLQGATAQGRVAVVWRAALP